MTDPLIQKLYSLPECLPDSQLVLLILHIIIPISDKSTTDNSRCVGQPGEPASLKAIQPRVATTARIAEAA